MNTDICFLILNYNGVNETTNCINSILSLEEQEKFSIVVVDNASTDGSAVLLKEYYKKFAQVIVLELQENRGFSGGNNYGAEYIIRHFEPEFIVVCNSDTLFLQQDFAKSIKEIYQKSKFDILGPDIYVPDREEHQSPLCENPPDLEAVNRTILLNQIGLIGFHLAYPFIKNRIINQAKKRNEKRNYGIEQKNVCLHGSCMIYAADYVRSKNKLFYPETFFYYEEFIQTVFCLREKKKVIYSPSVQVIHLDSRTINYKENIEIKKVQIMMTRMLAAARIYRKFLTAPNYKKKKEYK